MIPLATNYFDAHTHTLRRDAVCDIGLAAAPQERHEKAWLSVGLHPWKANEMEANTLYDKLISAAKAPGVVALGECGADRAKGPGMPTQTAAFDAHLAAAQTTGLPVIVHCVRAWGDLFPLLRRHASLRYIMHNFTADNAQTLFLTRFDAFFSFGPRAMANPDLLRRILAALPPERIVIESDASGVDIEQITNEIAQLTSSDSSTFAARVRRNALAAFNLLP